MHHRKNPQMKKSGNQSEQISISYERHDKSAENLRKGGMRLKTGVFKGD